MSRCVLPAVLALLGLATIACGKRAEPGPSVVGVPAADPAANENLGANAPPPVFGERLLDTSTPAAAPEPTSKPKPAVAKPGSDENLPSWVPLSGRLTVVEAPDLAENLGLVPKGATKTAEKRIVVADVLAQMPPPKVESSGPRSATWIPSTTRVRRSRGR